MDCSLIEGHCELVLDYGIHWEAYVANNHLYFNALATGKLGYLLKFLLLLSLSSLINPNSIYKSVVIALANPLPCHVDTLVQSFSLHEKSKWYVSLQGFVISIAIYGLMVFVNPFTLHINCVQEFFGLLGICCCVDFCYCGEFKGWCSLVLVIEIK